MKLKIWVALVLVYIIWGATYLGIRVAVETIPPFLMAGSRFLLAGAALYIWRRSAGDPAPTAGQWLRGALVGLLMLFGGNGLLSLAEKSVASGVSALIIGSAPLWMTGMEALRPGGARPNWLGVLGLVIGFGGIALLVGPPCFRQAPPLLNPLAYSSCFWRPFSGRSGRSTAAAWDLPKSSLLSTAIEMLGGGVGLYIAATLAGEWRHFALADVTWRSWVGFIYLTLFGSLVGFTAYAWLLRNAPVSLVSTYAYVNPLVAILLGSLLAQETLTVQILLAAAVIVGSVIMINISRQIKARDRTIVPAK